MDLITITVKYNVSTFLWNMANPKEFWNHELQAKIFMLLISDAFLGENSSSRQSSAEHFFAHKSAVGFPSQVPVRSLAFLIEGSPVHLWNPRHMLKQTPSLLDH